MLFNFEIHWQENICQEGLYLNDFNDENHNRIFFRYYTYVLYEILFNWGCTCNYVAFLDFCWDYSVYIMKRTFWYIRVYINFSLFNWLCNDSKTFHSDW